MLAHHLQKLTSRIVHTKSEKRQYFKMQIANLYYVSHGFILYLNYVFVL